MKKFIDFLNESSNYVPSSMKIGDRIYSQNQNGSSYGTVIDLKNDSITVEWDLSAAAKKHNWKSSKDVYDDKSMAFAFREVNSSTDLKKALVDNLEIN